LEDEAKIGCETVEGRVADVEGGEVGAGRKEIDEVKGKVVASVLEDEFFQEGGVSKEFEDVFVEAGAGLVEAKGFEVVEAADETSYSRTSSMAGDFEIFKRRQRNEGVVQLVVVLVRRVVAVCRIVRQPSLLRREGKTHRKSREPPVWEEDPTIRTSERTWTLCPLLKRRDP
jgi:hypothetical protein